MRFFLEKLSYESCNFLQNKHLWLQKNCINVDFLQKRYTLY